MEAGVKTRRRRLPRGTLSREQVVDAALRLADASGLESLSMPNLARSLGCGVMTIYGHVASKGDLLDAIAQRGLADLRLPRPMPEDVGGVLKAWGRALRTSLVEHPSLPVIFLSQPVIGPGIFHGVDRLLGALDRAGMPPVSGVHAVYAVMTYTTGFIAWEVPRTRRQPQTQYASSWRREFASLTPTDFSFIGGVLDELGQVASESQFDLGLEALATGLAALSGPKATNADRRKSSA
jgi:TetR/AcrR family tetracycline transcriptional repressor